MGSPSGFLCLTKTQIGTNFDNFKVALFEIKKKIFTKITIPKILHNGHVKMVKIGPYLFFGVT